MNKFGITLTEIKDREDRSRILRNMGEKDHADFLSKYSAWMRDVYEGRTTKPYSKKVGGKMNSSGYVLSNYGPRAFFARRGKTTLYSIIPIAYALVRGYQPTVKELIAFISVTIGARKSNVSSCIYDLGRSGVIDIKNRTVYINELSEDMLSKIATGELKTFLKDSHIEEYFVHGNMDYYINQIESKYPKK